MRKAIAVDHAQVFKGILLLIAAVCSFSVLDTLAKYLSKTYPVMMIVWARYFFHVLVMLLLWWPTMGRQLVATRRPGLQVVRGLVLALSSIMFFTSLSLMPLADASAITQIAPILVTLAAMRWLGESAPPGTWIALAVSFCGVLLIVRPGGAAFTWAALFPIMTAMFFCVYQVLTRKLSNIDDGVATLFIGGLAATVLMSGIVPLYWTLPKSLFDAALFVTIGAIGAFGHLLLVRAFAIAPASTLAPFTYFQMVVALCLGFLVFGAFPDGWALLGMLMILSTGVAMAVLRRAPAEQTVNQRET